MSEENKKKIDRLSQVLDMAARSNNPRDYEGLIKLAVGNTEIKTGDSKCAPTP